ncbi:MAG: LysR family transcriptional regulator [Rickettsiales bacterium]|nr:LysR family transcriptional regulator [Rickettsiales bacterium]
MLKEKDFYYKKNRIAQLRGLCAVFQSDYSVTEAAEKVHIARSALSKQISALERDLGIQLFDRSEHKKLKPTKEGSLFYRRAIQYMNGIDGLFEDFNENLKEYNDHHLNIALHQIAIRYIFPQILKKMLKIKEFQDLQVNIYNFSQEEAMKKLINKEVDLSFHIQNVRDNIPTEIRTIKSKQSHAFLLCNKSHLLAKKDNITMEDIKKFRFLKRETGIKSFNNFDTQTTNVTIVGNAMSHETIVELIKNTDNVAIVPNIYLNNHICLDNSEIVFKDIEYLFRDKAFFNIMTLKNYSLSRPAMWIINELRKLK